MCWTLAPLFHAEVLQTIQENTKVFLNIILGHLMISKLVFWGKRVFHFSEHLESAICNFEMLEALSLEFRSFETLSF